MCPSVAFLLQTFGGTSNMLISLPKSSIKIRHLCKSPLFLISCWSCGQETRIEGVQVFGMFLQWGANMDSYCCQAPRPRLKNREEETKKEKEKKKLIFISSYRYTFPGFRYLLSLCQWYLLSPPSWLLLVMETPGAGTHQTSLGERVPKFAAKAQGLLLSAPSVYFLASNQHPVLTTSLLFAF